MKNLILFILLTLTPLALGLNAVDKAQFPATNYITNGGAEQGRSGFARYADDAGTSPVDGTAGSPNASTTLTTTSSSPIAGVSSLLFSKDAVNRQGEGFSYDFSIDRRDQAKVLAISFDYEVSANFVGGASSDMQVWVYDKTNAVLIQPTTYLIEGTSASGPNKFIANFQTASNSTSYRLIWHVATTSALAYTFKVDSIYVSREPRTLGVAVTDWQSYTPTFTGFGTAANISFFSRRVGDSLEILGKFTTGTTTATEARISLGFQGGNSNVTSDTTKIASIRHVGSWASATTTATTYKTSMVESGVSYLTFGLNATTTAELTKQTGSGMSGNANDLSVFASVPISGWSSSVVLGSDADTRVVVARVSGDAASATVGNPIILPTISFDTHGGYSASTGRYTVPVAGYYRVHGYLIGGSAVGIFAYVNAVSTTRVGNTTSNSGTLTGVVKVNAGDLIDVRPDGTFDASADSQVSFERITGPSAIAASESIAFSGQNTAGTSVSADAAIPFATKIYDTHGTWVTDTYTVPIQGKYRITANFWSAAVTLSTSQVLSLSFKKNSTEEQIQQMYGNGASHQAEVTGSKTYNCLAGDTLQIWLASGVATTLDTTAGRNYVNIERVGNY